MKYAYYILHTNYTVIHTGYLGDDSKCDIRLHCRCMFLWIIDDDEKVVLVSVKVVLRGCRSPPDRVAPSPPAQPPPASTIMNAAAHLFEAFGSRGADL